MRTIVRFSQNLDEQTLGFKLFSGTFCVAFWDTEHWLSPSQAHIYQTVSQPLHFILFMVIYYLWFIFRHTQVPIAKVVIK